jgi:hypothetical protein
MDPMRGQIPLLGWVLIALVVAVVVGAILYTLARTK